jgi:hypothetical protein
MELNKSRKLVNLKEKYLSASSVSLSSINFSSVVLTNETRLIFSLMLVSAVACQRLQVNSRRQVLGERTRQDGRTLKVKYERKMKRDEAR